MGYLGRRLLEAAGVIYLAVTLSFLGNRLTLDRQVSVLQREVHANPDLYGVPLPSARMLNDILGSALPMIPGQPLSRQYAEYLRATVVDRDFGESLVIAPGLNVVEVVARQAPWTVVWAVAVLLGVLVLGLLAGGVRTAVDVNRSGDDRTGTAGSVFVLGCAIGALLLAGAVGFSARRRVGATHLAPGADPGKAWAATLLIDASVPAIAVALFTLATLVLASWTRPAWSHIVRSIPVDRGWIRSDRPATAAVFGPYTGRFLWTAALGIAGTFLAVAIAFESLYGYLGTGHIVLEAYEIGDYPVLFGATAIVAIWFVVATLFVDVASALAGSGIDASGSAERAS